MSDPPNLINHEAYQTEQNKISLDIYRKYIRSDRNV